MREHHSAGSVIMIDGRVLVLGRNDREEWVLPNGQIEAGERPGDTTEFARRLRGRASCKVVDWFPAERIGGEIRLGPLFAEWWLPDEAVARARTQLRGGPQSGGAGARAGGRHGRLSRSRPR